MNTNELYLQPSKREEARSTSFCFSVNFRDFGSRGNGEEKILLLIYKILIWTMSTSLMHIDCIVLISNGL